MAEAHSHSFVGVNRLRAILFTLVAGAMFAVGVLFTEFVVGRKPGRMFQLGVLLLFLLLVLTALQAYFNGSTALGLLTTIALPFGFWAAAYLPQQRPFRSISLFDLRLGIAVGLLFGVTGHLLGAQLATLRDTASNPSYRGQLALAALMFGFLVWHLVSA